MAVRLLPAYQRGGYNPFADQGEPLDQFAALVRSVRSGQGRYEARWHRTRSAIKRPAGDFRPEPTVVVSAWCGTTIFANEAFTTDDALDGFPVCGACEGKALGAGLPGVVALLDTTRTGVIFEPECITAFKPPKVCPGVSLEPLALDRPSDGVGVCAACGMVAPIKHPLRYSTVNDWLIRNHTPTSQLVDPCPRHAWDDLVYRDGTATCRCQRAGRPR